MAVQKGHPMWCRVYARKTPSIPVHNGYPTCIGCGFDVATYHRTQLTEELRKAGEESRATAARSKRQMPTIRGREVTA